MKIICDKCKEDISGIALKRIENYQVGKTICPKCHYEQKRYISEADLLLYFGISEFFYMLFSLISVLVLNKFKVSIISIIIILVTLIVYFIISKYLASNIYNKAYFKSDIKNKVFDEDQKTIQRNITWQFMLFFGIVITFVTLNEGKIFFGIAMPIAVLITFIKFYFQLKYEKNIK